MALLCAATRPFRCV